MNIYKSVKNRIGAVLRNPEMLKFDPDLLKTKKICKHVVKQLPFLIDTFIINTRLTKCVTKLF